MKSKEKIKIKHSDLVNKGANFLLKQKSWHFRCQYAITEFKCAGVQEEPDVFGFDATKQVLIEVKVSRRDFLNDKHKVCRQLEGCSDLGTARYYLAPRGIIKESDLPHNWGLLEFDGKKIHIVRKSGTFIPNYQATMSVLYSVIRRTNKGQVFNF